MASVVQSSTNQHHHQLLKMKLFLIAAFCLAVAAAAPNAYGKAPAITITRSEDVRRPDASSKWGYSGSDGTTRDEANAQKQISSGGSGGYGKDSYETGKGNTNEGSVYYISPEGQKITLTWTADENGFLPKGDHLPVAPLPVALPYQRS